MHEPHPLKLASVALLAALALTGCTSPTGERPRFPKLADLTDAVADVFRSKPSSEAAPTAEALYKDGVDYFERGRYARSISFFQKLRDEHPFSKEADDAELKIAEVYYRNEEYSLSEETYKNYLTFQPTGQQAHFVKYQLGRVNLEQFTGIDRDLEKVREAKRHFESVIRDHPDSEHVADARKRLAETRIHLAERELYIGNYYLMDQRYRGARARFEKVLESYADTPAADRARRELARLAERGLDAPGSLPPAGGASAAPDAQPSEPVRYITKAGHEHEEPTRRRWYSYLNPFSWRRGNDEPAAPAAPQRGGGGEPAVSTGGEPAAGAAEAAAARAVMERVDTVIGTRETPQDDAPGPPVASLPPEEEAPGPEPDDPARVLGDVDRQLGGTAVSGDAPRAPAADPALFSVAEPSPAKQERAPGKPPSALLDDIDRQLGRGGTETSDDLPTPPSAPTVP